MTIAVLAVQGAFIEHIQALSRLGAECFEIRQKSDLNREFDGLILPGGESTVQGKLLRELGLLEPLKKKIEGGLPVLATCAGMILLASSIAGDETVYFGTMPIRVRRNAYGRQLGSFFAREEFKGIGKVPMSFIRAPYVEEAGEGTQILAVVEGNIVAVSCGNQIALSFHPELDTEESDAIHRLFLHRCQRRSVHLDNDRAEI